MNIQQVTRRSPVSQEQFRNIKKCINMVASYNQNSTKMNFKTILDDKQISPEHSNRYFKAVRIFSGKL